MQGVDPQLVPSKGRRIPPRVLLLVGGMLVLLVAAAIGWWRLGGSTTSSEQGPSILARALPPNVAATAIRQPHGWAKASESDYGALRATALAMSSASEPGKQDPVVLGIGEVEPWEIFLDEGLTTLEYARILDFFAIELGLLDEGDQIIYIGELSKPKPKVRNGPRGDERRLYLSWHRGDLEDADRKLVAAAGLSSEGKMILHFVPDTLREKLAEVDSLVPRPAVTGLWTTRFGLRRIGPDFQWYVIDRRQRR